MISGRQALAQIEQTIAKIRQQEAQLERNWQKATEDVARLRIERTEAFRELARLKLDSITKNEVVGQLDDAERQAVNLIASRREALNTLTAKRREAEERVRRAEAERHSAAEALETALGEVEALRKGVEAQIRVSTEWTAARARLEEVTGHAQQAEKKAVQAETDQNEKRRPYEADPLFMYLWKRKFGSSTYRVNPFSRFMDRLVARVVGYDKARANYVLLNEIPARLREHARRLMGEMREERDRLTALERKALVAAGIESVEGRVATAQAALEDADRRLAEVRDALTSMDRTYDSSVLEGDAPFREAVEVLAAADAREDLNQLYQEALRTPTPQDEEIVRRIQQTDTRIDGALRHAVDAHRQLQEVAQRRGMIEHEWEEFRRQGYDNPAGSFGNEVVLGNVLGGLLTGAVGGAILGEVLRGGFHQGPSPWDSGFGGGIPFPQPGGFGTGGSFGGGGGGFRTGGSF